MTNWTKQKLGVYVTFKTGKLNSNAAVFNGKYPFFTCSQEIYKTNTWSFDTECVLLGGNNASAVYPLFYYKGKFDAYQRTYIIEPRSDNNIRYFYYAIRKKLEDLRQQSTGATTRFLTIGILNNLQIEVPKPQEQSRVASLISAYDELIDNNEKRIKILEEMAQRLYTEWFVKFNFPGHQEVKMIDSLIGKIPDGWKVMPLNQAILVNPTSRLMNRENLLHVPMESLSNSLSVIDINKTFRNDKISGPKFMNGDTLFSRITPCLQNGKTGYVNMLRDGEIACGSTEFVVFRPNLLTSIYIYLLSRTNDFRETAILTMVGASGRQRVRSEFFQSYKVLIPSKDLLNAFESKVSSNFSEIKNLHYVNDSLRQIRDLLIPELIAGKKMLKN